jgi:hypothetical protein
MGKVTSAWNMRLRNGPALLVSAGWFKAVLIFQQFVARRLPWKHHSQSTALGSIIGIFAIGVRDADAGRARCALQSMHPF